MEQAGCAWTMDKPPASITTQTESKSTFQTRERALEVEANVESQLFFPNISHPGTVMQLIQSQHETQADLSGLDPRTQSWVMKPRQPSCRVQKTDGGLGDKREEIRKIFEKE